jgi:uncharacterized protein (UPF0335 family)
MNIQDIDHGTVDRLEQQKQALARHIRDLENQLVETGRHYTAITETILRLRKKRPKTEHYS